MHEVGCLEHIQGKERRNKLIQCPPPSLAQISLSYNGGKDCLVLLILLLASLSTHPTTSSSPSSLPSKLQSVYIISPHPFAEVDSFVSASETKYALDLARYAMPMKEAFRVYLEEHRGVKAILVGTRRTDPHGQMLTHFDETDKGWPAFMRVHPVIDWHYAEIWAVGLSFFLFLLPCAFLFFFSSSILPFFPSSSLAQ